MLAKISGNYILNGSSSTGTSSVHLHNEFIASANADYGNGKIKITSMQPTKGGEQATIVLYDSEKQDTAMTLSQVSTVTKTMQHSAARFPRPTEPFVRSPIT